MSLAPSTVLRVKRRLEETPQDALVLTCKRIKTDEEVSPSLFVFRGTVTDQDTINVSNIFPQCKENIKHSNNVNDIINKIRKEKKEISSQNRYEVVNCSRGIKENVESENHYDLVDLQKSEDCDNDTQYAYDLYTATKQDFDISMLDNLISIENYETNLIFGSHRDNGRASPSSNEGDDDDDSNDENNWRNEYPDSEPSSIDEEDMIRAMENVGIEDDLSSDTGEDKIYDEAPDYKEDVKRYGAAYAQYKARMTAEDSNLSNSRNFVHCTTIKDIDKESLEGYKNDSDDGFYYGEEEDTEHFREQYKDESTDEYSPD